MDSFGVTASQMDRVLAFLDALAFLHFNLSVSESAICFSVNLVMQVIQLIQNNQDNQDNPHGS